MNIDAVAHHRRRVKWMAVACSSPHLGAVEGPGEEGDEAEPCETGQAVVAGAVAEEAGDGEGEGEGGGDVVAEVEEGCEVWGIHAAGAAAALAGPDEVVEFACFGAFGLGGGGLVGWGLVGGWGGGGDDSFEGGKLVLGGAEGGGEVCEAGEEVGVGLEVGGRGGVGCCGERVGGRGWFGGWWCGGEKGGEVFVVGD